MSHEDHEGNIQFTIPNEAIKCIEPVGVYTYTHYTEDNTAYLVKLIRANENEPIIARLRLLPCGKSD